MKDPNEVGDILEKPAVCLGHLDAAPGDERLRGMVERLDAGLLKGWVVDLEKPEHPVELELVMLDVPMGRIVPTLRREDIDATLGTAVVAGFAFDILACNLQDISALRERLNTVLAAQTLNNDPIMIVSRTHGRQLRKGQKARLRTADWRKFARVLEAFETMAAKVDPERCRSELSDFDSDTQSLLARYYREQWRPEPATPAPGAADAAAVTRAKAAPGKATDSPPGGAAGKEAKGKKKTPPPSAPDQRIEDLRPHFDTAYYLGRYTDVAAAGIDPIVHYLRSGWREGRDPAPDFSTRYYLDNNPDILNAQVNPFWHYIVAGRSEGRLGMHPGGFKAEALEKLRTLPQIAAAWRRTDEPSEVLSPEDVATRLTNAGIDSRTALHLSISHDNYLKHSGGVQLCIQREQKLSVAAGQMHINLHPWQPLPCLSNDADPLVDLLIDGVDMGTCLTSSVTKALKDLKEADLLPEVRAVVHHLMGHSPERIGELIAAVAGGGCAFWLHDFLTLCPSYALQRNTVDFCNAPEIHSNACSLCVFGEERASHLKRMQGFFEGLSIHVLSPSAVTRTLWQSRTSLPVKNVTVAPHVTLNWKRRTKALPVQKDERIRVAFMGTQAAHKGWLTFSKLARHPDNLARYQFFAFGTQRPNIAGVEHVPVHVTADNPDAMIDAVRENNIDLVLHWANWPETFSISTYEALAAGAYVITNPISGNVVETVRTLQRGAVMDDEAALLAFFDGPEAGTLAAIVREQRAKYTVAHTLSKMSLPFLSTGEL